MRSGIYLRISKDAEARGLGVKRQERDCRKLAGSLGWEVVGSYQDNDVSGRSAKRPGYDRLWQDVAEGKVEAVLAYHPDRLYRRLRFLEDLIDRAEEHGAIPIRTVVGGDVDLSTPTGRAVARTIATWAQAEAERTGERVLRKHEELAENGLYKGGPRPYGFRVVEVDGGKSLEPVAREAWAIRDAAGRIIDGEALRSVTRRWNEMGLRTPERVNDGKGSKRPGGGPWSPKSVKGVLTSPGVAGLRERRGEIVGRAKWSAILDKRTWNRVRDEFARRAEEATANGYRPSNRKYLATGFLRCSSCSQALVGHPNNGRRSYTCLSRQDHPKGGRPRIQADPVEAHVLALAQERKVKVTTVLDPTADRDVHDRLDEIEDLLNAWAVKAAGAGLSASEIRAGREPLLVERTALEKQIADRSVVTFVDKAGHRRADLDSTARRRAAKAKDGRPRDPRSVLETTVDHVVVRPSGRSKHVPIEERVEVVWRS